MRRYVCLLLCPIIALFLIISVVQAEERMVIDNKVDKAIMKLISEDSVARVLLKDALAVLVFPDIKKASFVISGYYGEGALRINGKTESYYNTVAGSAGFQTGVQKYGYAVFFMNAEGLNYLREAGVWELEVGPSVTVVDKVTAKEILSTATLKDNIYALFFDEKGVMCGGAIKDSKITKMKL